MSKKKSIVLLSIFSFIIAVLLVMTFVSFNVPFMNDGANKWNSFVDYADLDVDLNGGYSYDLKLSESSDEVEDIDDVVDTLKTRLNALGYENYKVTLHRESADAEYGIRLIVKATENTQTDINAVIAFGEAEFVDKDNNLVIDGDTAIKDAYFLGDDFVTEQDGKKVYPIAVEFTDAGYEAILDAVVAHEAENAEAESATDFTLKLAMGGDYSNPVFESTVKSAEFGKVIYLQTDASKQAAERLAFQMKTGGLKYQYEVDTVATITPLLGENSALLSLLAIVAFVVVVGVALALLFKGAGLSMFVSLLAQVSVQAFLLYLVPDITLSFGSIIGLFAGFTLATITVIVLANNFKKEYASGKTLKSAIAYTYRKSSLIVVDGHVVSGALALGLFIFTKGVIRDFAIMFGISVIASLIFSVCLSWLMIKIFAGISDGSEKFLGIKRADGVTVEED